MKLTTIALAIAFSLSSTFALAQTTSGGSTTGMSGTRTGSSMNTKGSVSGATGPPPEAGLGMLPGTRLCPTVRQAAHINSHGPPALGSAGSKKKAPHFRGSFFTHSSLEM
jgi:hypothetical protein